MTNSTSRTKIEAIQDMSASTGAIVFAGACVLNIGLLVYVTIVRIG